MAPSSAGGASGATVSSAGWPAATVTSAGRGPIVVCVHGMLLDRTMFAPQLEGLADRMRIVAYDSRGRDPRGLVPYDLDALADDCATLIAELAAGPVVIAGMSMGGLVAMQVALTKPELVHGLVLISTSALPEPEPEREQLRASFARVSDSSVLPEEFVLAEASAHCSVRTRRVNLQIVEQLAGAMRGQTGRAAWLELESWLSHDLATSVGRLRTPALIVHGDEDELVPVDRALETRKLIEGSNLLVVPYAGHAVSLEAPATVNRAMSEFIEELGRQ